PEERALARVSKDTTRDSSFSRQALPEVYNFVRAPKRKRTQGRPGARCTRGLVCILMLQKMRTRAYRFSGNTPAFPAQWLDGVLRAPWCPRCVTIAPGKR